MTRDDTGALPPLREVMRRHGLEPTRALGQNFILDLNLTARISRAGHPLAGRTVIEVGPGPGGLTRAILDQGAARVVAIERDRRCIAALQDIAAAHPGRLEIIEADALELDMAALAAGAPAEIVANLPYNVATPLVVGWLSADPWPPFWTGMTLMFQREVAERLVAEPGSKTYGRLSVLAGWRARARIAFDVHPSAFVPPPKVVSSVVAFEPRAEPEPCPLGALEQVTQAAFGQRRKMLRQSLKSLGVPPETLLDAAGVRGEARAEEVPVAGFAAMARALAAIVNDR